MGWRPHEVRACTAGEFMCAFSGWAKAQGVKDDKRVPDEADRQQALAALEKMKHDGLLPDSPHGPHTSAAVGIEGLIHGTH